MPAGNLFVAIRRAVAVCVLFNGFASAQPLEPMKLPPLDVGTKLPVPVSSEPVLDRDVRPAQRLESPVPPSIPDSPDRTPTGTTVPTGVSSTGGRGSAPVADPPPPVVQLQVRTPSHVPLGKPVPYKITATNTSQAKALRVKVRLTAPEGAAAMTKCEPLWDGAQGPLPKEGVRPMELSWIIPKLSPGESKAFEAEFLPAANGKQFSATAYVSFEYGARVETIVDKPKVTVKKTATSQVSVGELITVQVGITNTSPVPVPNAVLIESVPPDVEIRGDTDAEKTNNPGQRSWKLGTIAAGQTKVVTYQLLARKGMETVETKSFVNCEVGGLTGSEADSKTKVVVPALRLDFTGPPKAEPRATATYSAVVRNVGTMPLSNVRLTVDVPNELRVTKVTNGCRTAKNPRVWIIPTLLAGESQEFRVNVESDQGVSGRQTLKATVRDSTARLEDQTREVTTEFIGRPHLTWKPTFDNARLNIGRQGTLTVAVRNQGAETDKGVRLRVSIPPEVKITDNGPVRATLDGNTLVFPPQAVGPGKTLEFTVTYEGKLAGQAQFRLMLEAESLEKAVTKDQSIEIER